MLLLTKRDFLKKGVLASSAMVCLKSPTMLFSSTKPVDRWTREALFYIQTPRGIKCTLCPNECVLKEGETGLCHSRIARNDKLYTLGFGNPCATNTDPIEKKPFYHFLPSSQAYSIGVAGCNFACLNCQNYQISQVGPPDIPHNDLMPHQVVEQAIKQNCASIAYTYTEPTIFYEYMLETATLARKNEIRNLIVSNGYINKKPLRDLCKVIDAASIDLKSFDDDTYAKLNAGKLQPVLDTLKILKEEGVWVEVSYLVIPKWSDNPDMIKRLCEWLAKNGFTNQPLHFLRFFPTYKLTDVPHTPFETLIRAREIAQNEGFKYVYIGNVPGEDTENTLCPQCKKPIIQRKGFYVLSNHLENGKCKWCRAEVNGVWG